MQSWELELKQIRQQERDLIEKSFYTEDETKQAQDIFDRANSLAVIEKAFQDGNISEDILQKARTKAGVYANTPENKKKGIVGMKYKVGEGKEDTKKEPSHKPGDTTEYNGKKYKKQSNGKWMEVSEQGMTKKEHEDKIKSYMKEADKYKTGGRVFDSLNEHIRSHHKDVKKLSDKEHTDEEVGLGKRFKVGDSVEMVNDLGSLKRGDKVKILSIEERPYNEWDFKTGKKVSSGKRKMYKVNIPKVGNEWITDNHFKN